MDDFKNAAMGKGQSPSLLNLNRNPDNLHSFLSQCIFSSESLSSFSNQAYLIPVCLPCPSASLSQLSCSTILQKSIQSLENIYKYTESYSPLISSGFLSVPAHSCAECGRKAAYHLKCGHYSCSKCLLQSTYCPACGSPKSFYDLNISHYICIKCKKFKKVEKTCKHFCIDCVVSALRFKSTFKCEICSVVYENNQFLQMEVVCESCKTKGMRLEDWFFEICKNHLICYSCIQKCIDCSSCMVCEKILNLKELYKLKKKLRVYCEICVKLKKLAAIQNQNCCKRTYCKNCFQISGCIPCSQLK